MTSYNILTLVLCLLLTSCYGASIAKRDITQKDIIEISTVMYNGSHDIVSLGVSFITEHQKNDQESDKDGNADKENKLQKIIFFIEADINENGDRVDHGLYVLKDGVKTKLLDNARDIAVVNLTNPVYFAAKDGIYVYNELENKAHKYGSVNDEIISIAAENGTGVVYYLNRHHQLYKVTEQGNKHTIIDEVKNAQEIVVDFTGHIYYYVEDKEFYVYDGREVKKIDNVPVNLTSVKFLKNPVFAQDIALFCGDGQYFHIVAQNATVMPLGKRNQMFNTTAMSADTGLIVYFAYDKKIYEYDLLGRVVGAILEAISNKIKNYFQSLQDSSLIL